MTTIINGRKISKEILDEIKKEVALLPFQPVFCDILVGDDPVSLQYVNMKKNKGFSLIELLISIAIMAILGSIALTSFTTIRKQARDQQRKTELNQYKTALEAYYADNSSYPLYSGSAAISNQNQGIFDSSSVIISTYFGGTVLQGVNAADNYLYYYISDSVNYKLWGNVEINSYFEIFSNGKSGYIDAVTTTSVACNL